jgi:glycosyltransferase involved in cell wall biosynthesis
MTTWAMCLAYNEATLIQYWVRHYRTFCDTVIVYVDTDTDDLTAWIADAEGAEVRDYVGSGHLDDIAFVRFAQDQYKEARGKADWVIWTDVDEIVYHPRIGRRLEVLRAEGINVPIVQGYNMFGDGPPVGVGHIYDEIRRGVRAPAYDKVCIFDPSLDLTWTAGKHDAAFVQPVRCDDGSDPLRLLHYRWLGEAWHVARNARNFSRINAENLARRHGFETYPGYEGEYSRKWYREQAKLAYDCL